MFFLVPPPICCYQAGLRLEEPDGTCGLQPPYLLPGCGAPKHLEDPDELRWVGPEKVDAPMSAAPQGVPCSSLPVETNNTTNHAERRAKSLIETRRMAQEERASRLQREPLEE
ncbi:hypothetical protein EYF80_032537 [Liparis tanakae]|uniref:Uncharacterized protein n=1 Tax=Liparis tanakae TaxID=230148 RepID=A0A4Z2GWQ7_9TELE|nr:hypothetical protein EYF80_032537 [Liparis tanakae]